MVSFQLKYFILFGHLKVNTLVFFWQKKKKKLLFWGNNSKNASFTFSKSTQEKVKYSAPKIHIKIIALHSDILYLRMMKQTSWIAEPYKSFLISFGVEGKGELFKEKMIDYICLWVIRLPTRTNSIDSEWLHTVWGQKRHTESGYG